MYNKLKGGLHFQHEDINLPDHTQRKLNFQNNINSSVESIHFQNGQLFETVQVI